MEGRLTLSKQKFIFVSLLLFTLNLPLSAFGQTPPWLETGVSDGEARQMLMDQLAEKNYRVESASTYRSEHDDGISRHSIYISGELTPKTSVSPQPGEHGKVRAIAKAFLDQEALSLFGVAPTNLRESTVVSPVMEMRHSTEIFFANTWTGCALKAPGQLAKETPNT